MQLHSSCNYHCHHVSQSLERLHKAIGTLHLSFQFTTCGKVIVFMMPLHSWSNPPCHLSKEIRSLLPPAGELSSSRISSWYLLLRDFSDTGILVSPEDHMGRNWVQAVYLGGTEYTELPWWLSSKELACNTGDWGSIPGWGRYSGEGNGNPFQYSCLGNPKDRGAWRATDYGVTKESNRT